MRFLWWLTKGRPMRLGEAMFHDLVNDQPIYLCTDKFGRFWLAKHPWALFRMRAPASLVLREIFHIEGPIDTSHGQA